MARTRARARSAAMSQFTRRKLIAGAAVAPLALNGAAAHPAPASLGRPEGRGTSPIAPASKPDPILAKTVAWTAERDAIDAMMREWQDHEAALCARTKPAA